MPCSVGERCIHRFVCLFIAEAADEAPRECLSEKGLRIMLMSKLLFPSQYVSLHYCISC